MVVLKLLGTPDLSGESGRLTGPATQRHRLAMLAVLAASHPCIVPREKLMALLWPERDGEHVRNLLKQSVYVLRRALGDDAIHSVGDALQLDAGTVACDVIRFQQAIADGSLDQAAALYTGPFLDGFMLGGAQEFQAWAEQQRTRLGDACSKALETLGEAAETRGDRRSAMTWWSSLARHDPFHTPAVLGLMRALEAIGEPARALRHAEDHARLLREELGIRPPSELSAMVARLQGLQGKALLRGEPPSLPAPASLDPPSTGPAAQHDRFWRRPLIYVAAIMAAVLLARLLWDLVPDARSPTAADVEVQVARAVAREVDRRLHDDRLAEQPERRTRSIAAYERYLRGDDPALLRSPAGARRGMEYFRQAVDLDPAYAAAWAGLARLSLRVAFDGGDDERRLLALAEEAALKAVELDESLADAHATIGLLHLAAFDLPSAETSMKRAVALDPTRALLREWLVSVYLWTGKLPLALAEAERAVRLDPLSPSASAELARALAANGRCAEALVRLEALTEIEPPLLRVPLIAAQCYAQQGSWQRAIAELRTVPPAAGHWLGQAFIGYALARAGRHDEALRLRQTLLSRWQQAHSGALPLAMLHAGLGETGEAFTWLERSLADKSLSALPDQFTLVQPMLEQLRGDSRFERLPPLSPWAFPPDATPAGIALTEQAR